ncbi:MAG: hypothetical protein U0838_17210 [Chloroflexota bacterium]
MTSMIPSVMLRMLAAGCRLQKPGSFDQSGADDPEARSEGDGVDAHALDGAGRCSPPWS